MPKTEMYSCQKSQNQFVDESSIVRNYREARIFALSEEEEQAHMDFMAKNLKNAVWLLEPEVAENKE